MGSAVDNGHDQGLDGFDYYVGLGPSRSYQAVAEHLGVAKRTIARRAKRGDWQDRLARIDAEAAARSEEELTEVYATSRIRHIQAAQSMLEKGLDALRELKIDKAADAVRLIEVAVKVERMAREEPINRVALEIRRMVGYGDEEDDLPAIRRTPFLEMHHGGAAR